MTDTPTLKLLLDYRDRNVHVVGVSGTEGFAILSYLMQLGFTRLTGHNLLTGSDLQNAFLNAHVALTPTDRRDALQRLMAAPIRLLTGPDYLKGIGQADLIFATQNWFAHTENKPLLQARESGIPMYFLTQLYFALSPAPILAVTGTNGKTTVTTCLTHILKTAGHPCLMSGNDRYHPQVLDILDSLPASGALVLEVSNRQLKELRQGPHIAILTNIRPDHIDEHGSFENYRNAKTTLFTMTSNKGFSILNAEDSYSFEIAKKLQSACILYGLDQPAVPCRSGLIGTRFVFSDAFGSLHPLFELDDLKLPGRHNRLNCLAAATAACVMGISSEAIRDGIRSFPGVKHRMELLAETGDIRFYDDEASTNPDATRAALESFGRPVVLICGGDEKGNALEYQRLAPVLQSNVAHIIHLPGSAGDRIAEIAAGVPTHGAPDLTTAMDIANQVLRPGDALLLSPGGAGFHSRFNAGSHGFRRLVRDWVRRSGQSVKNLDSTEMLL